MKKPATWAGCEGELMSWYEYKPEPKHYNPEPPDGNDRDAAAALGLIVPVIGLIGFLALLVFALLR